MYRVIYKLRQAREVVHKDRRGIAATIIVVIIVVVIAVAGVGAYIVLSGGSSPSSSTGTTTHSASSTSLTGSHTSTTHSSSTPLTTTTSPTTTVSSMHTTTTSSPASSVTSYSCSTTYSNVTAPDFTNQYIQLIRTYSAMQFQLNETSNGHSDNGSVAYKVTSSAGGIYDANITFYSQGTLETSQVKVDANNNTVLSVTVSFEGYTQTYTGSQAKTYFDAYMGFFGLEVAYATESGVFTDSTYFHSTGSSTKSFGPTSFSVTTWVANNLPFSLSDCGVTDTITGYTLQVGSPPGTSLTFVTYLHIVTTSPNNSDVTFQLVSMTVA